LPNFEICRCNYNNLGSSRIGPNFAHVNLDMFTISANMRRQDIWFLLMISAVWAHL
jgi:hypothetical protein